MQKISRKVLVLGVVGVLVVVGLGYAGYMLWQKYKPVNTQNNLNLPSLASDIPSFTQDCIQTQESFNSTYDYLFYISGSDSGSIGNVTMQNKIEGTRKNIIEFNHDTNTIYPDVHITDENSIALIYNPEHLSDKPQDISVYLFNLPKKVIKKNLLHENQVTSIISQNEQDLIYLSSEYLYLEKGNELRWNLKLTNNNETKILYQSPKLNEPNYLLDFSHFSFSPDKTKVLFLVTPLSRGFSEPIKHAIYSFNLNENIMNEIGFDLSEDQRIYLLQATVSWLDDRDIFVFLPKMQAAIYDSNLLLKENLIQFPLTAIGIALQNNKENIAYWENRGLGEIWTFNLQTKINTKIIDNYRYPQWFSNTELLVAEMEKCIENDNRDGCSQGRPDQDNDFIPATVENYFLYNLETKEKIKYPGLYNITME